MSPFQIENGNIAEIGRAGFGANISCALRVRHPFLNSSNEAVLEIASWEITSAAIVSGSSNCSSK